MSSTISVPDPCLLAILLVCQTREGSGPQLVFHWPPDPLMTDNARRRSLRDRDRDGNGDDYDSDTDSDEYSSDDNDYLHANRLKIESSNQGLSSTSKPDRSTSASSGQQSQPTHQASNTLFGLDEDGLLGLLAPDRTWHKRKFELSVNDLTFVGRPVFAKQDGFWRKHPRKKSTHNHIAVADSETNTDDDEQTDVENHEVEQQREKVSQPLKSQLIMFHAVFVMNPPPLDHSFRVKEMYDNVIKKFSKAMKWVQAHNDYVWQEADKLAVAWRKLLASGVASRDMIMNNLVEHSSLARALMHVFTSISASRIASISLGQGMSLSLQIPPITSTSYLPSLTEPPIPPGLWLTTATETPASAEENKKHATSSTLQLAKSYTLLLKSRPQRIAKDAQMAGGPVATHLPKFVAALRPTKSFYKLASTARISLADVQLLARHLIYWRRAIAIPPLHQRDTYIVSPNADLRKLREACKSYETEFPSSLPSLTHLLHLLSGTPRPFMTLIPSHDHKEIYMLVLAWLMRNGWVTQLRTFAFVRVDARAKSQAKEKERQMKASIPLTQDSHAETRGPNGQVGETHAVAESNGQERPSFVSRQSSEGRHSLKNSQMKKDGMASLIMNPPKASPEESRWMSYLHESILNRADWFTNLSAEERTELYSHWPKISKYFDGNTALETVPIRENLKRKFVWDLYGKFGLDFEGGIEDAQGVNDAMIVTIRHW